MKKFFLTVVVSVFLISCNRDHDNKDCFYYANPISNRYVFYLDNEFKHLYKKSEANNSNFKKTSSEDSIYSVNEDIYYYKKNIHNKKDVEFDTILLANDVKSNIKNFGTPFNLKIFKRNWNIGIYYPFEGYKGSYEFNITESENALFQSLISYLINNLKPDIYLPKDTINAKQYGINSIYIRVKKDNNCNIDYFGYLGDMNIFDVINQLTIVVIQNHINNRNNKTKKEIDLTYIRELYNRMSQKNINYFNNIIDDSIPVTNN